MTVVAQQLRKEPNWTILEAIRDGATLEFQRRVPEPTQANIQQTLADMWNYGPTRNEFLDGFINKVGMELARNTSWSNKLSKFKIGMLPNGDTIEEYIVGLIEAKTYDPKRNYMEEDLFAQEVPDVQTSYHKVNRQDFYKITINEPILKRAFLTDYGLFGLIGQLMAAPTTSDALDEYLLMVGLFKQYYDLGGFFKVNVPDIADTNSDTADAKAFIRSVRAYAQTLGFLSTNYNAARMPVSATPDELELFITPEGLAAVDVEALAAAFNLPYTEFGTRYTTVRQEDIGIPGAQAVLTTRDFFIVADQRIETRNQPNPVGLYDNFFLHHWQVISASRFVPAILFTSTEPTSIIEGQATPVTAIGTPVLTDGTGAVVSNAKVERGQLYSLAVSAVTSPVGGSNDAVRLELEGATSVRTILSQTGTLYPSPDEEANTITVRMIAVDDNTVTSTLALTVVGDYVKVWPDAEVLTDDDLDGIEEITEVEPVPAAPTSGASKNKVTIPEPGTGFNYKDGATTVDGQTLTLTADKTIIATAKAGYEFATGVVVNFPLVFTA